MVKDPVCGMEIDKAKAAANRGYESKTYYFCSTSCRDKFNAAPRDYSKKEPSGHSHGGCC